LVRFTERERRMGLKVEEVWLIEFIAEEETARQGRDVVISVIKFEFVMG